MLPVGVEPFSRLGASMAGAARRAWSSRAGALRRSALRVVALVVLALVVTSGSIALALTVTPYSTVSVAGQVVSVGAAAPSLSVSGPGELDLFGQELPTTVHFTGPVRPRLVLQRITIDSQLASLFATSHRPSLARSLGRAIASGLVRYFFWEALIAGACALMLIGALAGWWRLPWRQVVVLLGVGLVLVEAVDLGAVGVAAYGAPARLDHVRSLDALVGRARLGLAASSSPGAVPARGGVDAVVLGDSTAAGAGNPLPQHAALDDRLCARSDDSYAHDLAVANRWSAVNLACSGATVAGGLLGPQHVGQVTLPAQLSMAEKEKHVSVIVVSVGANDVGWSAMLQVCAVSPTCDNAALTAYFQQRLASFSTSYLQLLQRLAAFPGHPLVVVNRYYDPFDPSKSCLAGVGLDPAKERAMTSLLNALNGVIARGAAAASFVTVQPSFAGHALCDAQPYVQGLHAAAPFHPTASGELAIALADEQAVLAHRSP